jgi:hypothetical protein
MSSTVPLHEIAPQFGPEKERPNLPPTSPNEPELPPPNDPIPPLPPDSEPRLPVREPVTPPPAGDPPTGEPPRLV